MRVSESLTPNNGNDNDVQTIFTLSNEKKNIFLDNFSPNLFNQIDIDNEMESVSSCKWLVICTSCLFISLISWDIVGDKKGWYGGIWVPLSGIGMLIILWFVNSLSVKYSQIIK